MVRMLAEAAAREKEAVERVAVERAPVVVGMDVVAVAREREALEAAQAAA